jgi:hypothetical protein
MKKDRKKFLKFKYTTVVGDYVGWVNKDEWEFLKQLRNPKQNIKNIIDENTNYNNK